jgi:hypothetical protein
MKMFRKSIMSITLFICAVYFVHAQETTEETKNYFDIKIIQNNQEIPITDHQVRLQKKEFTLVLVMYGKIGVLTNFSQQPALYNGLSNGIPPKDLLEDPDQFMGMAEYDFNEDKKIIIDDILPHYLYYQNKDAHRFSSVERKNGAWHCYRKIALYSSPHKAGSAQISSYPDNELYISLVYEIYDEDYNKITKDMDYLKIVFAK